MRVLHLIDGGEDSGPPGDALAACRLLMEGTRADHEVCVIGGSRLDSEAEAAGLAEWDRIGAPLGRAALATRALRRYVLDRGGADVAHAWSVETLRAARRAVPEIPRVATPLSFPFATAAVAYLARGALLGVCGDAAAREWIDTGAPPARVKALAPLALPPERVGRSGLREALGLGDADVGLLLLGSPPHADALRFVFLVGLLSKAGVEVTAILPRGAAHWSRGLAFARAIGGMARIIVSDLPARQLLVAADLGAYVGGGPGPTSSLPPRPAAAAVALAQAVAAGVPVAAPAWGATDLAPPADWAAACLGTNATLPELARVLLPLVVDARLRARIASVGLGHARRQRWAESFVRGVTVLWAAAVRMARKETVGVEAAS
jgi:hypothetical protein